MTSLEPSVGSKTTDAYLAGFLFESLLIFLFLSKITGNLMIEAKDTLAQSKALEEFKVREPESAFK